MTKRPKNEPVPRTIALNPDPKGEFKMFGGSLADDWNMRLLNNVGSSVPVNQSNTNSSNEAITAVCNAMVDMAPADPIEGILIGQIVAASEASLAMYRKGWQQPPEYFAARTKYLQLADKAARTVVALTERLDHHRGRGQQQITVKHVTTNNVTADQAIIADSVTTGGAARSIGDLQDIVRGLKAKGASLKATEQPIDLNTAAGKCFLDMLGVFAEFETNLRKERQMEGIAKAKAAGVYKGRPPSVDSAKVAALKADGWGPSQIARKLNISRASVYRALEG